MNTLHSQLSTLNLLKRKIRMFLRRIRLPFVGKHLETSNQPQTGYRRINHFIHISQFRRPVRIGKLPAIIILKFFPFFFGVSGLIYILTEKNIHSSIRSHHSYFGSRKSKIDISADMLGAHHIISATVCFAGDNRNFRHCSLTISIKQFCPVTNNSAIFLIDSRKESRHIYQCQ